MILELSEKFYKCYHCTKNLSCVGAIDLYKHSLSCEKVNRTNVCTICNYHCRKGKTSLMTHLFTHTGEKPYQCSQCNYSFADRNALRRHEENPSIHNIKRMKKRQMGIAGWDGRYYCKQCSYSTTIHMSLARHSMIHTGEKPYKCSQCDYRCSDPSSLRRHERNLIVHNKQKHKTSKFTNKVFSVRLLKVDDIVDNIPLVTDGSILDD